MRAPYEGETFVMHLSWLFIHLSACVFLDWVTWCHLSLIVGLGQEGWKATGPESPGRKVLPKKDFWKWRRERRGRGRGGGTVGEGGPGS